MKVLLLSKYPRMGASSRLRSLQYIPALADAGIEVTVSGLFDDQYLKTLYGNGTRPRIRSLLLYVKRLFSLATVFRYDVVWIEKEIFPYFPPICEMLLSLLGIRYVVDYDDAIFHNYDMSSNGLIRKMLGRKIDVVMARSACVIAGNEYLASRALKAGAPKVVIIPTVVDHTRYGKRHSADDGQLVIGWIGSPSTQCYVVDIRDALGAVCDKFDARIVLVGASNDVFDQLPGLPIELVSWSEDTEVQAIAGFDIGIMPLPDGPWERGKCGYKLIQYMAVGTPVVASAVGVNIEIVQGWQCGRLADGQTQWRQALSVLLADAAERHSLGVNGRQAVEQHYSLQAQAPRLADILLKVSETRR